MFNESQSLEIIKYISSSLTNLATYALHRKFISQDILYIFYECLIYHQSINEIFLYEKNNSFYSLNTKILNIKY